MKYTLITLAALSGVAFGQTVTPDGASTTFSVKPMFVGNPSYGNLQNTIDGVVSASGFVAAEAVGSITYTFSTPVQEVTALNIWNNAGSGLSEGESIGQMSFEFFNSSGDSIYANPSVSVPEGSAGDPWSYALPTPIEDVASITLNITDSNGAGRGIALREFSVSVPEPSSAALLGLGGLALILRRRK